MAGKIKKILRGKFECSKDIPEEVMKQGIKVENKNKIISKIIGVICIIVGCIGSFIYVYKPIETQLVTAEEISISRKYFSIVGFKGNAFIVLIILGVIIVIFSNPNIKIGRKK